MNVAAPCSAGDFMTERGCKECGENSYSGDGASSCISCPDGQVLDAGSTSVEDCQYGNMFFLCKEDIFCYYIFCYTDRKLVQ